VSEFVWPVRVYYEDTDSGGVVYYANYLKFMERARTEWLRSLGHEQDRLIGDAGVIFAVRSVTLDYLKPARFNQRLQVSARLLERGGASLRLEQEVRSDEAVPQVLCRGEIRIVCLDAVSFRPQAIPDSLLMELPDVH
jgi:acyl-CoA thioester hydrolase